MSPQSVPAKDTQTFGQEFAALQRFAQALISAGHQVADPRGVALDRGGRLDPKKPFFWILADGRSSHRPPALWAMLTTAPAPAARVPRLRIARIMLRTATHVLIDIHDHSRVRSLGPHLGQITIRLGMEVTQSDGETPPQPEVFLDSP